MKFVRWLVHTGGAQGRELLHHACVFPHVCFPAAALISYHGVFLRDEKLGQEGDSHRTSYQRPPPPPVCVCACVCVFHFWFYRPTCEHGSRAGSRTIHTNPVALIYKSACREKCAPIIGAAAAELPSIVRRLGPTNN